MSTQETNPNHNEPQQEHNEPQQEHNEPQQEHNEPQQEHNSSLVPKWMVHVIFWGIAVLIITAEFLLIDSSCSRQDNRAKVSTVFSRTDGRSTTYVIDSLTQTNLNNTKKDSTITKLVATDKTLTISQNSDILDSIVYNLTLAVNQINNVLTGGSIALGILTLFLGLVGLFGYHTLKNETKERIDKFEKKIDDDLKEKQNSIKKIKKAVDTHRKENLKSIKTMNASADKTKNEMDNLFSQFKQNTKKSIREKIKSIDQQRKTFEAKLNTNLQENTKPVKEIQKKFKANSKAFEEQDLFIFQAIKFFYESSNSIANNLKDIKIIEQVDHNFDIVNLYRTYLIPQEKERIIEDKKRAINNIKAKGTEKDIIHLKYLSDFDEEMIVRKEAEQAIGYLQSRLEKEKRQEHDMVNKTDININIEDQQDNKEKTDLDNDSSKKDQEQNG